MKESALFKKARKKAELLGIDASCVLAGDIVGAFHDDPLNLVEYTLHEAAHYLTLGRRLDRLEPDVTGWVSSTFDKIPNLSADALEKDTALITYLAGLQLKLWDDPQPIIYSTGKNLRGLYTQSAEAEITRHFAQGAGRIHSTLVQELVGWWRAK